VQTELPGPSKVDTWYIAYAIELGIPVVTDDQDMTELAIAFDGPSNANVRTNENNAR
jgi:predicted nuclease of predicted toxin-antitoxin system